MSLPEEPGVCAVQLGHRRRRSPSARAVARGKDPRAPLLRGRGGGSSAPGSGVGQGGRLEPTTSRLPWFALVAEARPLLPWAARRLEVIRHSGLAAYLLVIRVTLRTSALSTGRNGGDPSSVICAGIVRPTLLRGWTANPSVHCIGEGLSSEVGGAMSVGTCSFY